MSYNLSEEERWNLIAQSHEAYFAYAILAANPEGINETADSQTVLQQVKHTKRVKIRGGDSIQGIAKKYSCTEQEIIELNRLNVWPFVDSSTNIPTAGMAVKEQSIEVPSLTGDLRITRAMTDQEQLEQVYYADFLVQETSTKEEIIISGGDFALATGHNNVKQATRLRMKRFAGWNLDWPMDGLPSDFGDIIDANFAKLFKIKVLAAIRLDPRIATVKNLSIKFEENKLNISYTIIPIAGQPFNDTVRIPK